MDNKEVKQAKKVLEEISQDEHERYLTELREKYIMDQYAIEDRAYDKGMEAGIQQGIKQAQIDIVKKMKISKIDISTISEITGLSKDEIEKIN